MHPLTVVRIVGTPVTCGEGVKEVWRHIAALAQTQLSHRFGDTVRVDYFDLFNPGWPPPPPPAPVARFFYLWATLQQQR
jgi:hypothetical protein